MKTFTLVIAAIVQCGSLLTIGKAASPFDVPAAVVKFGDLDTTHSSGKDELYRRLTVAAREVCRPFEGVFGSGWIKAPQYTACLDKAISGAVAQVNRPEFTDYVATRTQQPGHLVAARLATR
jgi:UrcA family protein